MNRFGLFVCLLPAVVVFAPSAVVAQGAESAYDRDPNHQSMTTAERERSERGNAWLTLPTHSATLLPSASTSLVDLTRESDMTAALVPQVRDRAGVPYMVAGGVLFIAGILVNGDAGTVLMIGGAGVGAYGAFVYFGG